MYEFTPMSMYNNNKINIINSENTKQAVVSISSLAG